MRLGVVPYLNCVPLVSGFSCEIYKAIPSKLAQMARQDDLVLAPIVDAFANPDWYLLEGVGIGSFGPVDTVRLFFNKTGTTIQNIKTILVDSESATSVTLLKVLVSKKYERNSVHFTTDKTERAEGSLLIGDKVWNQNGNKASLDLGGEWTEWTKLPFVYACWMTKNRELAQEWKPKLVSHAQKNLENLEEVAQKMTESDRHFLLRYWRQLCYELGPSQQKGIQRFQQYWSELERKPMLKLQWI